LRVKRRIKNNIGKIGKVVKPKFAKFRNDLPDEDTDGDYDAEQAKIDDEKEK
jgi:hypothetical protein